MWTYKHQPVNSIEDLPGHEGLLGYVYKITNLKTGQIYIGHKNLYSTRKKHMGKREKSLITDKRKKTYTRVTKESDWKTYWSSCTELKDDVKKHGEDFFRREIVELCCTKKQLTFYELKYMFEHEVLTKPSYNGNILGRFFRKDLVPCK